MSLDSIVNVTIENTTANVSRAGFGIPLISSYHTRFAPDRLRFYSTTAAMVADGFATTDPAYKAAAACFAQNPRPAQVAVGRRLSLPIWEINLTPTVTTAGYVYSITIGAETATVTVQSGDVVADICDDLVIAINALSGAFTATGSTTHVNVQADAAGTHFDVTIGGLQGDVALNIADVTDVDPSDSVTIADDLADFLLASDAWYGLVLCERGSPEISEAAGWVESNRRLMIAASPDTAIKLTGTGDIASTLKTAAYARSAVFYHSRPHQAPDAALFGKMLPKDPGSATWAYKTLAGISADTFTGTQLGFLEAKRALHYYTMGGVNITREGLTASGEWIDITVGLDWLRARLQERIYSRLVSLDKVPYTQVGLDLIGSEITAQLLEAVNRGLLAPLGAAEGVQLPDLADIADADKAARLLPDVLFTATLAGAIHEIQVNGKVSV